MEFRDNMGSLGFPSPPNGPVSPPPSPPDNENTLLTAPPTATLNGSFSDAYTEAARALWEFRKGAAKLLDVSVRFLGVPISVVGEYEAISPYASGEWEPQVQDSPPRTTNRLAPGLEAPPFQVPSMTGLTGYWTRARAEIDTVQPPAEGPPPDSPPGPPSTGDDGTADEARERAQRHADLEAMSTTPTARDESWHLRPVCNDSHGPVNEAYDRLAAGIIYECTQEDESSRLSPLLQEFGRACGIPTVNPTDEGAIRAVVETHVLPQKHPSWSEYRGEFRVGERVFHHPLLHHCPQDGH